jgi:hypothetical protein
VIELGRPLVALAGALLALVPLALHFISRRAPESVALPTARFLSPERLTRVHLQRRPTDLSRLLLRVLVVLALSSAFAEPRFSSSARGTVDLILLDGSAAMAVRWPEANDSVRAILARSGGVVPGGASERGDPAESDRRTRLIVFDTTARTVSATPSALDSLSAAPPAAAAAAASAASVDAGLAGPSADLSAALTALRATAASLPADSARAWLVFVSRRDSWRPGLAALREESWPGMLEVVALEPAELPADQPERPPHSGGATVLASSELEAGLLGAALAALGVPPAEEVAGSTQPGVVLAFGGSPGDLRPVAGALERGATVVLRPSTHAALPAVEPIWRPTEPRALAPHPLVRFRDGLTVTGLGTIPGRAAAGVRWLAASGDGEPAAVASPVGGGCLVTAAFDPLSLMELAPASLPEVLSRLLRGCAPEDASPDGALPLDSGALEVLRAGAARSEGAGTATRGVPPAVSLAAMRAGIPEPRLVRGLLLLALTAALGEAYLSYLRPRRRREGGAPE